MLPQPLPLKVTRLLNFFLLILVLLLLRTWILSVVQYDTHLEKSRKPMRKTVLERAERATIRDRFNLPLAINKMQYNVSILYTDIRQIPSIEWDREGGKRPKRIFARRTHVEKLAAFLANELSLDPKEIEDIILGQACLFPSTPFVIKEDISEELYFRLKMAEKDWLGLHLQRGVKRFYPQGKIGCDVIGYIGAIAPSEYRKIAEEIQQLKTFLEEQSEGQAAFLPRGFSNSHEVAKRLQELEERTYTINDQMGKSGIEAQYDSLLRGSSGQTVYSVDMKGTTLEKLPESRPAQSGERVILSLSIELQKEAEKLLAQYEELQEGYDKTTNPERRHPWQRGGAIVAMHPKTGEVIALASYPRYNPNDLLPIQDKAERIEKRSTIMKWFESLSYIGEIWDGKAALERETYSPQTDSFPLALHPLTWDLYLKTILSEKAAIYTCIKKVKNIERAVELLSSKEMLEEFTSSIPNEQDKLLFHDLLRLCIKEESYSSLLGNQSLATFRHYSQLAALALDKMKKELRAQFHAADFKKWRENHFKEFLKEKRREEKNKKRYVRPYTEYLEQIEQVQFERYWKENKYILLHNLLHSDPLLADLHEELSPFSREERIAYLKSLRTFEDLNRPLLGRYPRIRSDKGVQLEKHLAAAFYPYSGFGYGRSYAYRQAVPMGSIFKLIPAYLGIKMRHDQHHKDLNPLTLTDDMRATVKVNGNEQILGYLENGEPIKRLYHGGRLPRGYPNQGLLNVQKAIERTSNIYFSILAGDIFPSPRTLLEGAKLFNLGSKTGIDLPAEYPGNLPDDVLYNKTGLYAFAIGQHSLVVSPLQTALMISTIANGGDLLKPHLLKFAVGKKGLFYNPPTVQNKVALPESVQSTLLEGMHLVTNGERGTARQSAIRTALQTPETLKSYRQLHPQMVGKTGTAEIMYKQTIDSETEALLEKHVSFGTVYYPSILYKDPELVVVVYLRFGTGGKQAAPLAARLIEKWEEIKKNHCRN